MWGLKGFKERRSNVYFYLSHNFVITMRGQKYNCTKLYLVKQPVQLLLRVEKRMKISYALSSSPSFVLAWGGGGGKKEDGVKAISVWLEGGYTFL